MPLPETIHFALKRDGSVLHATSIGLMRANAALLANVSRRKRPPVQERQ